jgi:hypothetical protein
MGELEKTTENLFDKAVPMLRFESKEVHHLGFSNNMCEEC